MNPDNPVPEPRKAPDLVIRPGRLFVVQGPDFRCVAVCDVEGRWQTYYSHKELLGPVKVLHEL